jgi:glycosyltransferase involved in cell wall biosynthesis
MAVQAAKTHDWRFVFGTLPPISAGWIAGYIARRLHLPFVLEFRDVVNDAHAPTGLHRAAICLIEKSLVRAAAGIVAVHPAMKNWIVDHHGADPDIVQVITTGFMPKDRQYFTEHLKTNNKCFTMLHAGMFSRDRKPDVFLKAVRNLIDRRVVPSERIKVVFLGNLARSAITDFGLDNVAETIYMVPHDEVFKWYGQADLLFMFCPKREYQTVTYPGKIFECLATGKPILALADKKSDTARVLEKSGLGLIADADDMEEVSSKLEFAYNLWDRNEFVMKPDEEFIEQFNCQNEVKKLASMFDGVVFS